MKLILEFEVVHFMFELILNQLFYYVLYHHLLTGLKSINKSEYVVKSHALIVTVSKFKGKRSDCIITIFSGNFTRFFVFYSFCFIVHLCKVKYTNSLWGDRGGGVKGVFSQISMSSSVFGSLAPILLLTTVQFHQVCISGAIISPYDKMISVVCKLWKFFDTNMLFL